MLSKKLGMAIVATSLSVTPVTRAMADGGDVVGGIIGGIIGGAIVSESQKKKRRVVSTGVSSATRAANRETQTALNYFGYPAGTPDGVLGSRSRSAISAYQAQLSFPVTGRLSEYERDFLIRSYYRAQGNPMEASQLASQSPTGMRGVLVAYRDIELGRAPATTAVVTPVAPAPQTPDVTVVTTIAPATPAEPAAPAGALPNFLGGGAVAQASLASHCNKVSLLTNTNGGFTTLASMSDPKFALGEQFCLARTYAIAQGEELANSIAGVTMAQMEQQCAAFGPAMQSQIAALSLKPSDQVLQDVGSFVLSTGMSPGQLSGTAKICLSVGYRTDNMDVALGSALLLAALGEKAYGELLGHHLSQGFGTSNRADLSLAWYQMGLDAVASGSQAVFAPGQPERNDLIRKAAFQIGGVQDQAAAAPTVQPVMALPKFDLQGTNN